MESRLPRAGRGKMGEGWLGSAGFIYEMINMFSNLLRCWQHHSVNILKATQLYFR